MSNSRVGKGLLPGLLFGLYSLTHLNLNNCNLREGQNPEEVGCLVSLEELYLSNNNFVTLPASISQLSKLRFLDLECCQWLRSLGSEPPSSLEMVKTSYCTSLNTFLDPMSECNLRCSAVCLDWMELVERQGRERTPIASLTRYLQVSLDLSSSFLCSLSIYYINEWKCFWVWWCFFLFLQNPPNSRGMFHIILPGNQIPKWFKHKNDWSSSSISTRLYPNLYNNKWIGFAICAYFAADGSAQFGRGVRINGNYWRHGIVPLPGNRINSNHLWLFYLPRDKYFLTECKNTCYQIEFIFDDPYGFNYKNLMAERCGVRLVCEKDIWCVS